MHRGNRAPHPAAKLARGWLQGSSASSTGEGRQMRFALIRSIAFVTVIAPFMAAAAPAPAAPDHDLDPGFLQLMGEFGRPAEPLARRSSADGNRVTYQFPDGTRLAVRKSDAAPGKASVSGLIGSGRLGLPDKLAQSAWGMAFLPLGGTSAASYEEIERWLAASGHSVELNFNPELRGFRFWGSMSTQDLGYQIGLLCGIVRHAGMREVVSRKAADFGSTLPLQIDMNPQLVLARAIGRAASGLGAHYDELPLGNEISQDLPGDLQAIAERELTGSMDLAVVGDIDPDTAAAYVASTCAAGARPSQPRHTQALVAHFEKGDHRWTFVKSGANEQSEFDALIWAAAEYGRGDRHRRALDLLADVLRVRLSLRLPSPTHRVVPVVVASRGFVSDQFGFFTVAIEHSSASPSKPAELIQAELKSLVQDPALNAQLVSVTRQRATARSVRLTSNLQWAAVLAEGLSNPEAIARYEQADTADNQILTQDVRDAARWLSQDSTRAEISLRPRE